MLILLLMLTTPLGLHLSPTSESSLPSRPQALLKPEYPLTFIRTFLYNHFLPLVPVATYSGSLGPKVTWTH